MTWTFVLTDRFGAPIGELRQAADRRLRFPLNRLPTFAFTIDAGHALAAAVRSTDKTIVKGYQQSPGAAPVLRFQGPIISAEKVRSSQAGTIAATAAGVGWRLSHRLIGCRPEGATFATALAPRDRGDMVRAILTALNNGSQPDTAFAVAPSRADDTGIRVGAITASSSTNAGPWPYKVAADAIAELSASLDGFDWEIEPCEPFFDGGPIPVIGRLNVRAAIGAAKPDAVWEFGAGRNNVESWRDLADASTLCNSAISLPGGSASSTVAIVATDAGSIATRGLHEAVVGSDLSADLLRQQLVQEHVRVRAAPRRVISFQPTTEDAPADAIVRRVPRLFDDFIVGDIMPFRATETYNVVDPGSGATIGVREVKEIDALFRAFAVDLTLDAAGVATSTVTLVQETS